MFVDDHIAVTQGSPARLNRIRRTLLHAINTVFRPNRPAEAGRQDPISTKKLRKGDACWSTRKVVLGWVIDTLRGTVELPPHRRQRLQDLLHELHLRRRVSRATWHRFLGELRSMAMGLPGVIGLFSQLQTVLANHTDKHRVRIHQAARDAIHDTKLLLLDVGRRPTRLNELFPTIPWAVGACDAAKAGMGGVWFFTDPLSANQEPPLV